jgi:hypothetical protein
LDTQEAAEYRERDARGSPLTPACLPLSDVEKPRLLRYEYLRRMGFYFAYGAHATVPPAHAPQITVEWVQAWERWGHRVECVRRVYHGVPGLLALPLPAANAALHAKFRQDLAACPPDDVDPALIVARTNPVTMARRNLHALRLLHALGFSHPFAGGETHVSWNAWVASIDLPQLRMVWADGKEFIENGLWQRAPDDLRVFILRINKWLKLWWGVTCGPQHTAAQTVRTPKTRARGHTFGVVRWWRDAIPQPHKALFG